MPELPEVENVRQTLLPHVQGKTVVRVELRRQDIVVGPVTPAALLQGAIVQSIARHGKQLAIVTRSQHAPDGGPCVGVQLGMTGSLVHYPTTDAHLRPHTHALWLLEDGCMLAFADPRRFGGLRTSPSFACFQQQRWDVLGPDALKITPRALHLGLTRTRSPIKAALLNQHLIAGLGNIYVDEALFRARLHPLTPACRLLAPEVGRLSRSFKHVLQRAIRAGGSSIRDYVNAQGAPGGFQTQHQVYGRAGRHCHRCRSTLEGFRIVGRQTVCCPRCQPLPTRG